MRNTLLCVFILCFGCLNAQDYSKWRDQLWDSFVFPEVSFEDKAKNETGLEIFNRVLTDPEVAIQQHAFWIAQTLFESAKYFELPNVTNINFVLGSRNALAFYPEGEGYVVDLEYNVENLVNAENDKEALYGIRGFLYQSISFGYLFQTATSGDEANAYLSGMASAVRYQNEYLPLSNRVAGGNWTDGGETTGFFLQWLAHIHPDFLRKMNQAAKELTEWSMDSAIKYSLGSAYGVNSLWKEYQDFLERSVIRKPHPCAPELKIKSAKASGQVNVNEGAAMAIDGKVATKWCCTSGGANKWLEVELEEEIFVCQWTVLHAGAMEGENFITSAFGLQVYQNDEWVTVDDVKQNTENFTNRTIDPVKTSKVRLAISKGAPTGANTARIFEFKLYGNESGVSIDTPKVNDSNFSIINNSPNPFSDHTNIEVVIPNGVNGLILSIYNVAGNLIEMAEYPAQEGTQQIEWTNSKRLPAGIYPYTITISKEGKTYRKSSKMYIK